MEFGDYKSAVVRKYSTVCMQLNLHDQFQEVMKVSETERFACDFCDAQVKSLHPINDGAWAICGACMDIHYRIIPEIEKRKEPKVQTVKSDRYDIYGEEE